MDEAQVIEHAQKIIPAMDVGLDMVVVVIVVLNVG